MVDRAHARDLIKVILAGPICEGKSVPRWPLLTGESRDEDALVTLASYLELEESDYQTLVAETYELVLEPRFAAYEFVFTTVLESRSSFNADLIRELLENGRIAHFVNSKTEGSSMRRSRRTTHRSRIVPDAEKRLKRLPKGLVWIVGRDGEPEQMSVKASRGGRRTRRKALAAYNRKHIATPTIATFEV